MQVVKNCGKKRRARYDPLWSAGTAVPAALHYCDFMSGRNHEVQRTRSTNLPSRFEALHTLSNTPACPNKRPVRSPLSLLRFKWHSDTNLGHRESVCWAVAGNFSSTTTRPHPTARSHPTRHTRGVCNHSAETASRAPHSPPASLARPAPRTCDDIPP